MQSILISTATRKQFEKYNAYEIVHYVNIYVKYVYNASASAIRLM